MQEYDVALKLLLQSSARRTMLAVIGAPIEKWLDVELPKVENPRVDLLGETAAGELAHLELQSTNDAIMPLRMAEYCLRVYRLFKKFPRQILLYVGEPPQRMETELRGEDVWFRYRTIDVRTLDGDALLESEEVGDNVIAILTRLRDHRGAVRKIVERIAGLKSPDRETAFQQLLILAGLRRMEEVVQQEARKMPIEYNILENRVLGPKIKQALEEGRQEGVLRVLRRQIEKRFGPIPTWAEERLTGLTAAELEELVLRVLDARSLEELLQ